MKKLLSLLLCLALLCGLAVPALAAEEAVSAQGEAAPEDVAVTTVTLQEPSPWTLPYLADARALKLVDDNYGAYITSPVTPEQIAAMAEQVYAKLALLSGEETTAPAWNVTGSTRGDVVNALGAAVNASGFDTAGAVPALQKLGVLQGDGVSLALERTCTYEEAVILATRLVLNAYDAKNAGSKGLLWKAVKGESTVYLLGTAHMERGNLYPFHQTLRNAIQSADTVVLELDFQDEEGMAEFVAMQSYPEGDGLKNHIPEELYTRTVNALAPLGLDEATVNTFKPWALASTFTSLLSSDETAGVAPLAIDFYVNAAAVNAGKTVTGAESYALQGGIFDTLSDDYQAAYLDSGLTLWELSNAPAEDAASSGNGPVDSEGTEKTEEEAAMQAALDEQQRQLTAIMDAWQAGDAAGFEAAYGKEGIVNSDDELNARLFTDRDPNMVKVAQSYLDKEGKHTALLAFGAGHMVAPGGIVPALQGLGYTVEQVTDYQATPPTPSVTPAEPAVTPATAPDTSPVTPTTTPETSPAAAAEPTHISLSFAGDTMLATYPNTVSATNFNGYLANQKPEYFLGGVQEIFQKDDFTIVNLENVLSDRNLTPTKKNYSPAYWYKGAAKNANILSAGGVEVVSLSNNHTDDYGAAGLADTKAAVEAAGLQWGNRDKTVYLEKEGYKIAVICSGMWNKTTHLNLIRQRLAEAAQYSDFQIVFFHGGTERVHQPDGWKVEACRALVDAGADLVVGSHPHCLQPREVYKGVDIVYSMGNFCYGGSSKPENATVIYRLELEVEDGKVTSKTSEIVPCYVYTGSRNNFRPEVMADSPEKQAILDFMNWARKSPV